MPRTQNLQSEQSQLLTLYKTASFAHLSKYFGDKISTIVKPSLYSRQGSIHTHRPANIFLKRISLIFRAIHTKVTSLATIVACVLHSIQVLPETGKKGNQWPKR
ncbi:MAG: hypothetical protein HYX67_10175 [Candidatus Melainabacteria bacterium]|nr:hypothetical protein [Candidatus Melainabacteria bacterium]